MLNSVAVAASARYLSGHLGAATDTALVHGFATATAWSAVGLAVVTAVTVFAVRTPRPDTEPAR